MVFHMYVIIYFSCNNEGHRKTCLWNCVCAKYTDEYYENSLNQAYITFLPGNWWNLPKFKKFFLISQRYIKSDPKNPVSANSIFLACTAHS